ncbi:MAG: thiol-disulfide oxidoreductase DCC family protein [Verrucomicrobiota bacterium]
MTETLAASPPTAGTWALYYHQFPVCRSTVGRWRRVFEARRIEFAPLQAPWVRERLGLAPGRLPDEMKLLTPDGRVLGGPDAIAWMCRRVAWLWPLGVLMVLPGLDAVTRLGYRWIARNRYCLGDVCELPPMRVDRRRHLAATTFLEAP